MATREYVVTVKKGIDWEEVHADLIEDTTSREGLDPNIVPTRQVAVAKLRQTNTRSTPIYWNHQKQKDLRMTQEFLMCKMKVLQQRNLVKFKQVTLLEPDMIVVT
mgnify:CR=1 FL=1